MFHQKQEKEGSVRIPFFCINEFLSSKITFTHAASNVSSVVLGAKKSNNNKRKRTKAVTAGASVSLTAATLSSATLPLRPIVTTGRALAGGAGAGAAGGTGRTTGTARTMPCFFRFVYNCLHRIAVNGFGRFARIVRYRRSIFDHSHISSPLRQILLLQIRRDRDRADRIPSEGCGLRSARR